MIFIKKKIQNQSAFTLVEVLAAVILLSIVIFLSISIFPQMANLNSKSENNLNTVNVGKDILFKMKTVSYSIIEGSNTNSLNNSSILPIQLDEMISEDKTITLKGNYQYIDEKNYKVDITISRDIESGTKSFRKITIDIKDSNNSNLTTTHGYLQN